MNGRRSVGERSKPRVTARLGERQIYRSEHSEREERKREREGGNVGMAKMEGSRAERAEEDRARSLSRICILIRNLAESFPRSPVVSYLILYHPLPPPSGLRRIRRLLALLPPPPLSRFPLLVPSRISIPVLFLPHYAGLAYPGRPALDSATATETCIPVEDVN